MSGHNKWSTIKRKKGAADAKRGQLFTRLAREIAIAAREGGSDIEGNFKLRLAVDRARRESMPKDNIDRAIKRGTGEGKDTEAIERVTYEGYAANGVAVMVDCLTENRNRTVSEVRHVLSHAGGSLAEVGAVSWQFEHICYFSIPAEGIDYDKVFEAAVEGGANDVTNDGEYVEIFGPLDAFKEISNKLEAAGVEPEEAELRFQPKQEMELDSDQSLKVLHVIDMLEDLDDVQNVFSNMALNEEALKAFEAE